MKISNIKKVLILGSNSLAASWTIYELLNKKIKVIGINRSDELMMSFLKHKSSKFLKFYKFYKFDLNKNNDKIIELILTEKPQIIIDFAGQGMVSPSWNFPDQWYFTNVVSKVKIHNALKEKNFLNLYIRISTPEVYGNVTGEIKENKLYKPSTPYAVSHSAIDQSLDIFHQQYGFPCIIARFSNFYGPYQKLYRIIPRTFLSAINNEILPLHGGGKSIRSFIYCGDVANAIFKMIQFGKIGEIYHFSSNEFVTISKLVNKISKIVGVKSKNFIKITDDRPGKDMQYKMNSLKARKKLFWKPKINLETGLVNTHEWIKKEYKKINNLSRDYKHKI